MNPIRCKAKRILAGSSVVSQCTLIEGHKTRETRRVNKHEFVDEYGIRHRVETIAGFDPEPRKFYDRVICRVCSLTVKDCKCSPLPCPFCDESFGFVQDWNVHLREFHMELI